MATFVVLEHDTGDARPTEFAQGHTCGVRRKRDRRHSR